jgi:kynurenine formamidase
MKYKLLSYVINNNTRGYGNTPKIKIKKTRDISKGDTCNGTVITIAGHYGTHLDTPRHFFASGLAVSDYSIADYVFSSPCVLECKKKKGELIVPADFAGYEAGLKKCDILLFRTGFSRLRGKNVYTADNPGISPDCAVKLRKEYPNIRCIGIDTVSISAFSARESGRRAHREFLKDGGYAGKPVMIIEDMDLSGNIEGLKRVFLAPLMIEGLDGVPCMVIGEMGGQYKK